MARNNLTETGGTCGEAVRPTIDSGVATPMSSGSPTSQLAPPASPQPDPTRVPTSAPPNRARVTAAPSRVVKCYLSIVVPAYNEAKRLPATLDTIADYLQKRDFSHELLVVDDGSRDATMRATLSIGAKASLSVPASLLPWAATCCSRTPI